MGSSSRGCCGYLWLQLRQVSHHLSAVRHQILQVILQTLQLLPSLRLLAAPLPQVGHTSSLELRVQLYIQRPLVENPLHLHLTVPGELQEHVGLHKRNTSLLLFRVFLKQYSIRVDSICEPFKSWLAFLRTWQSPQSHDIQSLYTSPLSQHCLEQLLNCLTQNK